ncbi:hypothetical protein SY83_05505 [Paenibacillus swuensis]|uniref:Squalene cyclase C-terminal domain-containing protein n=1 Tax=Paenibacillus swuensis TaxID=1178515 RepID=A0A172TFR8_9BACL|nr:hypothetical protein [Paenibacillus swuensis]ANE45850.1 hypothetical protein SY83_05505 [Paenibacillus swuensis]
MGKAQVLSRAKDFIYNNARLLDRKRYEYHLEGGSNVEVVDVLKAYQNQDGGFGNALEPDIRCPQSQPVPTELALTIMEEVGYFNPYIIKGIAKYLQKITLKDGGIPFVFKSASLYPHAPWWKSEEECRPSINPTGKILGYLYKQKVYTDCYQEEWFLKNEQFIWDYLDNGNPTGYHDGIQLITFLENIPDTNKADKYWPFVDDWLSRTGTIERNPLAEGYVHKVLDWCPVSTSYSRKFIPDVEINNHIQVLIEQQQEDGGWPINWPALSIGTELEWRGWITVERLRTLKSYGII